jgi:hypothetical protein
MVKTVILKTTFKIISHAFFLIINNTRWRGT